jgi:non-ribosomal peptide synthetase component E (peptide arylation enzyme)
VAGAEEILGEVGVAFVVVTPGSEAPTRDSLKAFLRERVADYKLPDMVVVKEALPVTAMGKVDKKALKEEAMDLAAHRSAAVAKERKERREQS